MVGRDLGHRRGTIYLAVHRVVGLEARPRSARSPYVTDADRLGGSRSVRACERCDVAGDVARLTQTRLSLEAERPSCGRLYCFFRKYTPSRRARLSVNHLAPRCAGALTLSLSLVPPLSDAIVIHRAPLSRSRMKLPLPCSWP